MDQRVTEQGIIKDTRRALGMNMRDFGKLLGVSHAAVALYENGESSPDDARLVAWMGFQQPEIRQMAVSLMRVKFNGMLDQVTQQTIAP